jgi:hypothetical protein
MTPSTHIPHASLVTGETRDATFTNGRYVLPRSTRGVLVLADPPETGWRLEGSPAEDRTAEPKRPASPDEEKLDGSSA